MRVLVVGGGLAGLTAAHDLAGAGHDVVLLEGAAQLGGKVRRHRVAGVEVDVGAEAMINRRPEGVDLARSLGLDVVHPTLASSRIWTRGALRPLPRTLLGAPLDGEQLAASGVLSAQGVTRALAEVVTPVDGDPSVGDLVAARFGDEVTDRLVEPMLGGVYAGRARDISARAAAPQLVALAERGSILAQAARLPVDGSPVFAGLVGGMAGLVDALATGPFEVVTGVQVREVLRVGGGFVARCARTSTTEGTSARYSTTEGVERFETEVFDGVVLATPAAPTARLLAELAPVAAAELAGIDSASMAVVTLAFRRDDVPDLAATDASGFLVPPVDRRRIKASTFSFAKWGWVGDAGAAEGVLHLRTSVGRIGEEADLQATDAELVARSLGELAEASASTPSPSTPTCNGGEAGCRSTAPATSTASPGSAPTSPASPASPSAAPPTTASASPPSSPPPTAPPSTSPDVVALVAPVALVEVRGRQAELRWLRCEGPSDPSHETKHPRGWFRGSLRSHLNHRARAAALVEVRGPLGPEPLRWLRCEGAPARACAG